jgi:hypothetical protein
MNKEKLFEIIEKEKEFHKNYQNYEKVTNPNIINYREGFWEGFQRCIELIKEHEEIL